MFETVLSMKKLLLFAVMTVTLMVTGCSTMTDANVSGPPLVKGPSFLNIGIGIPCTKLVVVNDTDEKLLISVDGQDQEILESRAKITKKLMVVGGDTQNWVIMAQGPSGTYSQVFSASNGSSQAYPIVINRYMLRR
ncbi:MAG: hypothetical protein RLZZ347_567 [Candidatus Parcubacteria bacterium]|jgi:hypothetical protein